jgi:predicted aspartyl protease
MQPLKEKLRQHSFGRYGLYGLLGISSAWVFGTIWVAPSFVNAQSRVGASSSTSAIVQLKGLNVAPPKVKGSATLPLTVLDQTQLFSAVALFGKLPGRFLIDTGASTTMLSAAVVKDLQLKGRTVPADQLSSAVAGNECSSMGATLHQLPSMKLQSVEVKGLSGLKFEKTVIPEGLSGVMGMDVLGKFDLQLNPKALTLKLSLPTTLPKASSDLAVPLQGKLGVFLAKLTLNGQGPFTLLLDTGADSTFISESVAQRLKLDAKNREPIQIQGFCGLEPAARSRLASIKLYQHEQKNLEAIVLSSSILTLLGVDGILGQNFFRHYQQHWRFTPALVRSSKASGSLMLSPQ